MARLGGAHPPGRASASQRRCRGVGPRVTPPDRRAVSRALSSRCGRRGAARRARGARRAPEPRRAPLRGRAPSSRRSPAGRAPRSAHRAPAGWPTLAALAIATGLAAIGSGPVVGRRRGALRRPDARPLGRSSIAVLADSSAPSATRCAARSMDRARRRRRRRAPCSRSTASARRRPGSVYRVWVVAPARRRRSRTRVRRHASRCRPARASGVPQGTRVGVTLEPLRRRARRGAAAPRRARSCPPVRSSAVSGRSRTASPSRRSCWSLPCPAR